MGLNIFCVAASILCATGFVLHAIWSQRLQAWYRRHTSFFFFIPPTERMLRSQRYNALLRLGFGAVGFGWLALHH